MNQWPYVIAAYGLTLVATVAIVWASLAAMRRAERDADAVRRK